MAQATPEDRPVQAGSSTGPAQMQAGESAHGAGPRRRQPQAGTAQAPQDRPAPPQAGLFSDWASI